MAAARKRNAAATQHQRASQRGAAEPSSRGEAADPSGQLRSLDAGMKLCARKYNEAKAQADRLAEEVKSRSDERIELEREAKALHEMLEGNNADARKITRISAEIDEANECAENILLYRHQLNHMHHRLRKNSVSLDGHIREMTATLESAQKERDRSKNMLAELETGLTCASIELDETIQDARLVQEERVRELAATEQEASHASKMEEWNRERVTSNLARQESFADANKRERERLRRERQDGHARLRELSKATDETAVELASFEESFAHVKQATGVNSLTEMVHKILDHERNHRQLMQEKKDAEERLKAAKTALSKDQQFLAKLKTNGFGTTELNREILDDIKGSIANEKTEGKIVKSTNKRLEALLVGLRQGGIGLYNRLLPFHSSLLTGEAPKLGEMDSTCAIQAASDTMEMISFTEKILGKMLVEIGGIDHANSKAGREKVDIPTERMNCRVTTKKLATTADYAAEDDDTAADSSDDIPSRTGLKMSSELRVEARRQEELKKTKKTESAKPPPSSARDEEPGTAAEPSLPATPSKLLHLTSPPRSRPKAHNSKEDPMERVQAFLTKLPSLE